MKALRQLSAALFSTLAVVALSPVHAAPIETPSQVVFESKSGVLSKTLTYPWGAVQLPRHTISVTPPNNTPSNDFSHVESGLYRPAGTTTQWIALKFRGKDFFRYNKAAHVPIFLRVDPGSNWYPLRGKGIALGYLDICGKSATVFTEVTANAPYGTGQGAGGTLCVPMGVALQDDVTYQLVMHVANAAIAFSITNLSTNQVIVNNWQVADAAYPSTGDAGADLAYRQMNASIGYLLAIVNPDATIAWKLTFSEIGSGWF